VIDFGRDSDEKRPPSPPLKHHQQQSSSSSFKRIGQKKGEYVGYIYADNPTDTKDDSFTRSLSRQPHHFYTATHSSLLTSSVRSPLSFINSNLDSSSPIVGSKHAKGLLTKNSFDVENLPASGKEKMKAVGRKTERGADNKLESLVVEDGERVCDDVMSAGGEDDTATCDSQQREGDNDESAADIVDDLERLEHKKYQLNRRSVQCAAVAGGGDEGGSQLMYSLLQRIEVLFLYLLHTVNLSVLY